MPLRYKFVRRCAQAVWRIQRSVTIGAQAMVLDEQSRVLLVRHGYQSGWHFPGGGVEKNECAEATITRELLEETGVAIDDRPELFGLYTNFKHFPSDHIALFVVRAFRQTPEPTANWEIRERKFIPLDALPEDATAGVKRRIAELTSSGPRATEW